MNLTKNPALAQAVEKAESLLDVASKTEIPHIADLVSPLKEQLQRVRESRFVIGVIGATKRGKSTLINALLGTASDAYAPVGRMPVTNVISIFSKSNTPATTVYFEDGESKTISPSEIRLYATEEANPGNRKRVKSIESRADFPLLEPGVFLVDTPGGGNALDETHQQTLLRFIPNADAIIFLVTAEEPLTQMEAEFLSQIRKADVKKLFFAINMVDRIETGDLTMEDLAQGLEHNRRILEAAGFAGVRFFEISAKRHLETRSDPGVCELEQAVRDLINRERLEILKESLDAKGASLREQLQLIISSELETAEASEEQIAQEIAFLRKTQSELEAGRGKRKSDFTSAWNKAFDDLEESRIRVRKRLHEEYENLITSANSGRLGQIATALHSDIAARFAELLREPAEKCENAILKARKDLTDQIAAITVGLETRIHSKNFALQGIGKNSVEIVGKMLPSAAASAAFLALPGIAANSILALTPSISSLTLNPFSWLGWGLTGVMNAGGTAAATVVSTGLAAVCMPLSLFAFGLSLTRAYSAWQGALKKQKNELLTEASRAIDECAAQIEGQISTLRAASSRILEDFETRYEALLQERQADLQNLISRRPPPGRIYLLKDAKGRLDALALPQTPGTAGSGSSGSQDSFASAMFG